MLYSISTPADISRICRNVQDGDTISLTANTYYLIPDGEKRFYAISNNDRGMKSICFPLIGKKNITVDGNGANLLFHGDILPFVVDNCENITLRNFSVDYENPRYAQAEILEADEHSVLMRFDMKAFFCCVRNGNFHFYSPQDGWERTVTHCLTTEFDRERKAPSAYIPPYFPYTGEPCDHGFLGRMFKDMKLTQVGEGLIRMEGNFGFTHTVGNFLIMMHATREYPGIFLNDSKNVTLQNITLYHTTAMGVIGQNTENITLDGIRAEVRENSGRLLSVAADATHFVNCRGTLTMKHCRFVNMMDDALNVHGIYHIVSGKKDAHTLALTVGHHQQTGIVTYRKGDTVALIDRDTLQEKAKLTVQSVSVSEDLQTISVTFDEVLPEVTEKDVTENLTASPEVYISDCESGDNRPRGFLLSSPKKTVVERCRFHNMNCGIQLGGEMKDWFESGGAKDVTIRDCDFTNSAYAGGCAITAVPHIYNPDCGVKYIGKVTIENNLFRQQAPRILAGRSIQEVIYRNNRFEADPTLPAKGRNGENGITLSDCDKITVEA